MKWSIRSQITAIFIGLIVLILAGMFVINSGFLGQYYVAHKEKDLVDTYEVINRALSDGKFTSESVKDKVLNQSEKTNIDISIMDTAGGNIIFSTIKDERGLLFGRMLGYFFDKNQGDGIVLESTDAYQILKATDTANKTDYLEMWGYFSDGSFFTMRSPLESIRESASLANKFLVYMGITGIVLGGILVWFFSKKITKPVLELAELSRRMANLDFNAKYTSGGSNEIGVLGESFNIMSKRLEKTVSELKSANNKLLKDIEQKEKIEDMRNEFLGNVSHELKTPIALIQGYAEGLKEGVNDDPESREFYCDVIMDEAGKMNQMVKNLLILNQLEFGSQELEFERFDIVVDEKDLHTPAFQIAGVLERIHRVSGKTRYLACDDQVELTPFCRRDHSHKMWTFIRGRARNTLVDILFDQFPFGVCCQDWLVPVHLIFKRR